MWAIPNTQRRCANIFLSSVVVRIREMVMLMDPPCNTTLLSVKMMRGGGQVAQTHTYGRAGARSQGFTRYDPPKAWG